MRTVITCTRCGWQRVVTPINPPNLGVDWQSAVAQRDRLGRCPECRDVNLEVERLDLHGQVVKTELAP